MSQVRDPNTDQPLPVPGEDSQSVHLDAATTLTIRSNAMKPKERDATLMAADLMRQRMVFGKDKYGTVLHEHNGRDAMRDLLEELADAVAYGYVLKRQGVVGTDFVRSLEDMLTEACYRNLP